jgi:hypothetical protein
MNKKLKAGLESEIELYDGSIKKEIVQNFK